MGGDGGVGADQPDRMTELTVAETVHPLPLSASDQTEVTSRGDGADEAERSDARELTVPEVVYALIYILGTNMNENLACSSMSWYDNILQGLTV